MKDKRTSRIRRARRTRMKIRELRATRLSVHRTPRHIYAQVISPDGETIITQASTLDSELRSLGGGNVEAAKKVGGLIAQRAVSAGVKKVAFDRSGFKFHGRIKALADEARNGGLEF